MSCPKCGSTDAVSKTVAWDALHKVPDPVRRLLDKYGKIVDAAQALETHPGDENTAVVTVPVEALLELQEALSALGLAESCHNG